ncbi:MAG TPA: hypothetical protein VJV78_39285 [Polyangiales bacterium]|nr:hypothetical protein [Polyangiales bacterium]
MTAVFAPIGVLVFPCRAFTACSFFVRRVCLRRGVTPLQSLARDLTPTFFRSRGGVANFGRNRLGLSQWRADLQAFWLHELDRLRPWRLRRRRCRLLW